MPAVQLLNPATGSILVAGFIQGVAQLGSARALGARGREFESHHPDHLFQMRDLERRDMVMRDR